MVQLPQIATVDAFVAWEETQDEKYEFGDGTISLFPSGTLRHDLIISNLIVALRGAVAPNQVHGPNVKQLTNMSSRYPDVAVSFDARDTLDLTYARYPTLVIEVLSPSTSATDRGQKVDEYRTIETLQEYLLVDSCKRWAQIMRRAGTDWIVSLPILSGALSLSSIGLNLEFDRIYESTGL